jgi:hydrogenase/urease accessory protein HupE
MNPVTLRIDALLLVVAVVAVIAVAPGHGVWGYVIGFVTIALLGAAVGLLGRKYPQIYRQRSRRRTLH